VRVVLVEGASPSGFVGGNVGLGSLLAIILVLAAGFIVTVRLPFVRRLLSLPFLGVGRWWLAASVSCPVVRGVHLMSRLTTRGSGAVVWKLGESLDNLLVEDSLCLFNQVVNELLFLAGEPAEMAVIQIRFFR
jgi:hypothetical protein